MSPFYRTILIAALLVLTPAALFAQRDSREVREASKFVALALTKQTTADRVQQYQQALPHLRAAMTNEPQNPKVWRMAGEVLAAVGEHEEANRAFARAAELAPAEAEEIAEERKRAWATVFDLGNEAMQAQQFDQAIRLFRGAEVIYQGRPEALLNLGLSLAHRDQPDEAISVLRRAAEAARGPLFASVSPEEQAAWTGYRVLAATNISILGVQSFQAEKYADAAERFRAAAEINPQARDHWYNLAQSLRAQLAPIEEQVAAAAAPTPEQKQQLTDFSRRILNAVEKALEADPNNEILYLIGARAHRTIGVLAESEADRTAAQQASLNLLERHDAMTVTLDEVGVVEEQDGVRIRGVLKNKTLTAGTPVNIRFTLVDLDGRTVGEQTITVQAPAADATERFEATATPTGEVAGWRYTIG